MVKILATLVLTIMCFLIMEDLVMKYSDTQEFFMWGWLCNIATGFFINWFVKAISSE